MEWLIDLFFWIVSFIQGLFQYLFLAWFARCRPRFKHGAIFMLFYCIINLLCVYTNSFLASTLFNMLALYAAGRYLMGASPFISALTSILDIAIMQLCYGFLNGIFYIFLPFAEIGSLLSWLFAFLPPVLSLILCLCCYRLAARYFAPETHTSNQCLYEILTPALLFFISSFYILNKIYGSTISVPIPFEPEKHLELLVIQGLSLCAVFSTLFAYQKLCIHFDMQSRLALLEQETHAQKVYVTEAKARYEQTKAFRHDIKNHLCVLDGLLKENETELANSYLEKLKSATADLSLAVYAGNPVIDILLSSKLELAKQNGIDASCSLAALEPCFVDDLDLCVIFSNALDNAINACVKLSGDKFIRVTGQRQGGIYLLEFKNNCRPGGNSPVQIGIGISNIKTVAEKYRGTVTIEQTPGYFCLDVLLNISNVPACGA